jgi:hypothetical protein
VAEVIQFQRVHFDLVVLREEDLVRMEFVVEEFIVTCRKRFEPVSNQMAIEFHEETNKGKVKWRNVASVSGVVFISPGQES